MPLCDQQIMNKLILAKMHFIICLSDTINNIPEKVEKCIYSVDNKMDGVTPSNEKGNNVRVVKKWIYSANYQTLFFYF